ncbi:hypothetical protein QQM79_05765 [Marinobacteraceae bacterium S3BR75-40.1]
MSDSDEMIPERREWQDEEAGRSVTGRSRVREQLAADIEAFLAQGGCITEVEGPHGDRPHKPAAESRGSSL